MIALSALIESKLSARGWSLIDLAKALAPRNPDKTLRKLRAVIDHGRCSKLQMVAICRKLGITRAEHEEAMKSDTEAWWNSVAEEQRQHFTPHLWIEVGPTWFPSLVTVFGAEFFRRVQVPEDLVALEDEELIIQRAGGLVADHYQSKQRRVNTDEMTGYLYRREFQLAYRFTPCGAFVEIETKRVLVPVTRWHL